MNVPSMLQWPQYTIDGPAGTPRWWLAYCAIDEKWPHPTKFMRADVIRYLVTQLACTEKQASHAYHNLQDQGLIIRA